MTTPTQESCKNCGESHDVSDYGYCRHCRDLGYGRGDHKPAAAWAKTGRQE